MINLLLSLFLSTAYAATYSCQTTYSELDIPYVKASSLEEYYYCFGLQHGQDRAWQMDFFRRVGEGRNAEVLGFAQLKSDLMMRLLDLPTLADKMWLQFPEDQKKWLVTYALGVNEGFKTGKNAQEFKDLNYEPETWKPEHTILILLLQSFDQTRKTFFRDYEEELSKEKWGNKATDLFDEDNMPWENNILKDGEYDKGEKVVKNSMQHFLPKKLWHMFPTVFGEESGSNNWVVSKLKSSTGKAILANDPHLDLKTPMFWYWINLKTPDMTVMGASVPGVPVIASGTNGKVAWGLTNSYLNAADAVFISDLKDSEIESVRPLVYVKFWFFKIPFFFKSFDRLASGHRVLPLESSSDHKLVLRWTGFNLTPSEIHPMFDLFKVQNVEEMNALTTKIGIPSWNFVFADANGDVGYRLVGKTYKNTHKLPFGIPVQTYEEFKHEEFLDPADRPHVIKPARQYVYTANNRHWPEDAKFYGGRAYSYSFRGLRIDELLQGKQDVGSFQQIQCDRQVVDARFFASKIQKHLALPELENWDMIATDSSMALPLYRRLMDLMMDKWSVNEYALYKLLDQLDEKQKSELKEILTTAKQEIQGRSWGEFHRVNFPHMTKDKRWVFAPEIPGVGDSHSVDPGTSKWNEERKVYEQSSGASMRMIIEMDKTPKIWLALPGINRHYDQAPVSKAWNEWRNCQYKTVQF